MSQLQFSLVHFPILKISMEGLLCVRYIRRCKHRAWHDGEHGVPRSWWRLGRCGPDTFSSVPRGAHLQEVPSGGGMSGEEPQHM